MKLYQHIAQCLGAIENCRASGNDEWFGKHRETVRQFCAMFLPTGAGFDNGTCVVFAQSGPEKIVLDTGYHHMNDAGSYDGWTEHKVTVTPSLQFNFTLKISGRDRNCIKEYIAEVFRSALSREITRAEYCKACGVPDDTDSR